MFDFIYFSVYCKFPLLKNGEMPMNSTRTLWLKAGIIGSTWAAFEIIVGSFLHNLQVPFAGTFLSAASVVLLISFLQIWKERGVIIRAGIICALMKSISPSAIIIGPMVGIMMEAVIIEFFVFLFGRNLWGYIVSGALAVLWSLIQKVLFLLLMYGLDLVELAKSVYRYLIKISGIDGFSAIYLIVGIVILYVAIGAAAAVVGYFSGVRYSPDADDRYIQLGNSTKSASLLKDSKPQSYSVPMLFVIVLAIVASLYFINKQLYLPGIIVGSSFVVFCVLSYKNSIRHLRKPSIWIQFFLITTGAAVLWDWTATGTFFSSDGLMVGVEMNFRAIIIIFGFAAVGVELRNPVITSLLCKRGFQDLNNTLTFAFSALPTIVESLPKPTHVFKNRRVLIARLLSQSQDLFNSIENQRP